MQVTTSSSRFFSIHPTMFFFGVILLLWAGTVTGSHMRSRRAANLAEESTTFKTLESAVLALLGLLLGFTFSMGVSRYDQRKNLEIAEANDLRAVWLRTSTLPEPARTAERNLLRLYLPVRLEFLDAGTSEPRIQLSLQRAAVLQGRLWQVASDAATAQPNPVTAQMLTSIAELGSVMENRTAAFENRIPLLAWCMLLFISFMASILVGVGMSSRSQFLRLILPLVIASALSLTLDLDSPRTGWIRVHQRSLERVQEMINASPQ